ncbi:hypothetical protein COW38_04235, partial [Candidatus Collierbacteria bacterium CG17_big_fil_post_rev_8_21_14_2_50_45_7]
MRLRWVLPVLRYRGYRALMKTINGALGFDASEVAKFRLRCIELFAKHGFDGVHTAFPQVSLRSLYRWRQVYLRQEKRLVSLLPKSTRPKQIRQMTPPAEVLSFLRSVREQHPHLSKYKLKVFLDAWCLERGLPGHSVSWIGKVIARYKLFFGTRKNLRKKRRKSRSGYIIKRTPNPDKIPLGYLQLDGVKVYWAGKEVLFLTALELKTRKAWAVVVPTINSKWARAFLLLILTKLDFPIHSIHTDNGSEFKAVFDQAVQELNLTHLWGVPRKPKIQAHIERFNGIFQEEFVSYHIEEAILNKPEFQISLTNWLTWYNQERPHHSLGML